MSPIRKRLRVQAIVAVLAASVLAAACGSSSDNDDTPGTDSVIETQSGDTESETGSVDESSVDDAVPETEAEADPDTGDVDEVAVSTFVVEVWADNWMAVYVNGQLIREDSVAITTERSFNAESFTIEAAYPFTIGIEAKDFKETDSGIEYIGQSNQQMGDGGLIAQVTDTATGEVVAVTSSEWSVLVVHRAPLNPECADDPDPDATCEFEISETPVGWADPDFEDSGWDAATEWTAAAVDPKDGYLDIDWDEAAQLIWGSDLEVDNTILTRFKVEPD